MEYAMNRLPLIGFSNETATRFFLVSILLVLSSPAWASLGDNVRSVQNDKAHMKGTLRSVATQRYVTHEIQVPTGQRVREFVSPDGNVFGVAWEGPFQPDLQQVLGGYFETMKQAVAAQQRHGHSPVSIETSGFVFQQGGHMRHFHGRAYVPTLLPPSVDPAEVQ
jgi:hypothetical protein